MKLHLLTRLQFLGFGSPIFAPSLTIATSSPGVGVFEPFKVLDRPRHEDDRAGKERARDVTPRIVNHWTGAPEKGERSISHLKVAFSARLPCSSSADIKPAFRNAEAANRADKKVASILGRLPRPPSLASLRAP
jgi:hypothetical protein